jgi:hypothetical protein
MFSGVRSPERALAENAGVRVVAQPNGSVDEVLDRADQRYGVDSGDVRRRLEDALREVEQSRGGDADRLELPRVDVRLVSGRPERGEDRFRDSHAGRPPGVSRRSLPTTRSPAATTARTLLAPRSTPAKYPIVLYRNPAALSLLGSELIY